MLENKCLRRILMATMTTFILANFIMPNYSLCKELDTITPMEEKNIDESGSNPLAMARNLLSGFLGFSENLFFD